MSNPGKKKPCKIYFPAQLTVGHLRRFVMIGAIIAKRSIRKAFGNLSNRNIDEFLSAWSEDAVFHYPGTANASGTFSGKVKVRAWFSRMLEQYPEIDFDVKHVCVENIFDLTGTNYVIAHWNIRLKRTDGKEFRNTGISTVKLTARKATDVWDFIFDLDKVKEAWSLASPELSIES
jgi:ketosteroid isomerase-like protein